MITKALLMVWLGFGQSQTLSITPFDTVAECDAALKAIAMTHSRLRPDEYVKCIPYSFEEVQDGK